MTTVQRKLVHKQFNSPIGLYSQQNVKETLDRELKAFGSRGIEVDEQITKPLNLASSAVLRAVEEEDQQKLDCETCIEVEGSQQRQSRRRHRYYHQHHTPLHQQQLEQIKTQYLSNQHDITIDRDTVLKINRLATRRNLHKRDHSWPPPQGIKNHEDLLSESDASIHPGQHGRSSSNDNAIHFDIKVCKRHEIDALREKFNSPTRIIEPSIEEVRQRRKFTQQVQQLKQLKPKQHSQILSSKKIITNKSSKKRNKITPDPVMTNFIDIKTHTSSMKFFDCTQLAGVKPTIVEHKKIDREQNRTDVGDSIEKQRRIYEKNDDFIDFDASKTPVTKGFSAPETKAADVDIGLVEPIRKYYEQLAARRCHSSDCITKNIPQYQVSIQHRPLIEISINNNRQSSSLDRGRTKRQQLPPLKPRASSSGGESTIQSLTGHTTKSPKQQRHLVKLATEVKFCYETDTQSHKAKPLTTEYETATTQLEGNFSANISVAENDTFPQLSESINAIELGLTGLLDLEHIPLPPTPSQMRTATSAPLTVAVTAAAGTDQKQAFVNSNDQRQKVDMVTTATQDASRKSLCNNHIQKTKATDIVAKKQQLLHQSHDEGTNWYEISTSEMRNIPVTVDKRNNLDEKNASESSNAKQSTTKDLSNVTAQQIYDDSCIYLRSIDLQDNTVAYIPAAITIVPSPTEEILECWTEPKNLRAAIEKPTIVSSPQSMSLIPTPPPPPPPPTIPQSQVIQTTRLGTSTPQTPLTVHNTTPFCFENNENKLHTTRDDSKAQNNKTASIAQPNNPTKADDISLELAADAPTYVSRLPSTAAGGGIQLTRQASVSSKKSAPNTPQKKYAESPLLGYMHDIYQTNTNSDTNIKNVNTTATPKPNFANPPIDKLTESSHKSLEASNVNRQRGIYYTDGEHLFGPFYSDEHDPWQVNVVPLATMQPAVIKSQIDIEIGNKTDAAGHKRVPQAQTNQNEIETLQAKYGEIQESITDNLRQIETYMQNAKLALSRSLQSERQQQQQKQQKNKQIDQTAITQVPIAIDPISNAADICQIRSTTKQSAAPDVETPLQAVLRQIQQQQQHQQHHQSVSSNEDCKPIDKGYASRCETAIPIKPIENLPIVEQALLDLSSIATSILDYQSRLENENQRRPIIQETKESEGSALQTVLKRLVALRSPETNSEQLITIEHTFLPYAVTPTHVTIKDDETEAVDTHVCLSTATATTKTPVQLEIYTDSGISEHNQKFAESVNRVEECQKIEKVTDVVANYEQLSLLPSALCAIDATKSKAQVMLSDACLSKMNNTFSNNFANKKATKKEEIEQVEQQQERRNLISGFIATRQDQEHLVEQVIDIVDAQTNQPTHSLPCANSCVVIPQAAEFSALASATSATASSSSALKVNLNQQQTAQSQQQSGGYKEKDVAIGAALSQPQKDIISNSAKATSGASKPIQHEHNDKLNQYQLNSADSDNKGDRLPLKEVAATTTSSDVNIKALTTADGNNDDDDVNKSVSSVQNTIHEKYEPTSAINDTNETLDYNHLAHLQKNHTYTGAAAAAAAASCPICGIKETWGKLTLGDQWRLDNLRNKVDESFDTYKATYEIPSPYVSRQISWEDTLVDTGMTIQKSQVQIAHANDAEKPTVTISNSNNISTTQQNPIESTEALIATIHQKVTKTDNEMQSTNQIKSTHTQLEAQLPAAFTGLSSMTQMTEKLSVNKTMQHAMSTRDVTPTRRYPAPLIEPDVPRRSASPFGLNVVETKICGDDRSSGCVVSYSDAYIEHQRSTSPFLNFVCDQKFSLVPQVEGHNVGLLVRTAAEPPSSIREHSITPTRNAHEQQQHAYDPSVYVDDDDADTHAPNTNRQENKNDKVDLHHFNSIVTSSKIASAIDRASYVRTMAKPKATTTTSSYSTASQNYKRVQNSKTDNIVGQHRRLQYSPFEFLIPQPPTITSASSSFLWPSDTAAKISDSSHDFLSSSHYVGFPSFMTTHSRVRDETDVNTQLNASILGNGTANAINRSFDNISPRPYISIEGYKRVAWPPVPEERIVREFTPQPVLQPSQEYYGQPVQQQQQQQQQPQPTQLKSCARQSFPFAHKQQQKLQKHPTQNHHHEQPQHNHRNQHQQHQQQQQSQHHQQPIQYNIQAQFNRQNSRESIVQPVSAPYESLPQQQYYQHQEPQTQHQHHQQPAHQQHEPTSPGKSGWRPIRPPVARHQQQCSLVGSASNYAAHTPTIHQQQQHRQSMQQYRASSYDNYRQNNLKSPSRYQQAQEQKQQHQQEQHSQHPTYPPHPKQYQKLSQQYQQQEQLPSWAHNQQPHPVQQEKFEPVSSLPPYQSQPYQQSSQTATNYQTQQHQTNQYHSYSQLQQQHYSQDQTDFQTAQQRHLHDYRSASPGIIHLRKETPISQKPAPVYTSQPVALSLQGGSHMRGDLKWPPPEYKEAAARENEERRKIAMGPVCRPRKVNRDYTPFFAKNSLNHHYASYKVPPGTQHIQS